MTENKSSTEAKSLPGGNELIRNFDYRLKSKNGFYVNRSYMQDSPYIVDWQLPNKKVGQTSH